MLYRRVNQLQRKRKKNFGGHIRTCGRSESTYGLKKCGSDNEVICYEFKEPRNYKNEYPKISKEKPKNKFLKDKKKVLMATWDDRNTLNDDFEEE